MPLDDQQRNFALGALAAAIGMASGGASAATYVVTSTANNTEGSLGSAIALANASEGPDTIDIQVTGTIDLGDSSLPAHSDSVGGLTIVGPGKDLLKIVGPDNIIEPLGGIGYYNTVFRNETFTALSISGMTITNANQGAIRSTEGGDISVEDVRITKTDAFRPLIEAGSESDLSIVDSQIDKVGGYASLIMARNTDSVVISGTEITDNDNRGLVVDIYDTEATISESVISGNSIPEFDGPEPRFALIGPGGDTPGIRAFNASLTVENTLFEKNSVPYGSGAAISATESTLNIEGSSFIQNSAYGRGGAVSASSSVMTISNSSFVGNQTTGTEGGEGGGALYFGESGGDVSISGSLFADNSAASGGGGAIKIRTGGAIVLQDSLVSNNSSRDAGGGVRIHPSYGTLSVDGTVIDGNQSQYGTGGLHIDGNIYADVSISQSTISNNTAQSEGTAGLSVNLYSYEGGVTVTLDSSTISGNSGNNPPVRLRGQSGSYYSAGMDLVIQNSTLSGNVASNARTAIAIEDFQEVDVTHSTLVDNQASGVATTQVHFEPSPYTYSYYAGPSAPAEVTITRSVLSSDNDVEAIFNGDQLPASGAYYGNTDPLIVNISSSVMTNGANAYNEGADTTQNGTPIEQDPQLGPLADNGGPTQTHAPLSGDSPVVDVGDGVNRPDGVDQRGVVEDVSVDLGAVEYVDPVDNTAPTLVVDIGKQISGKVGFVLPEPIPVADAFEDAEGDTVSVVDVTGLPAGLEYAAGDITGELLVPGQSQVTVTVTDDGTPALTTTVRFDVVVKEQGSSAVFIDDDDDDVLGGTPLAGFGLLAALAWLRRRRAG